MTDIILSEEYLAHVEALRQEERVRAEEQRIVKKTVYDELIELGLSEASALSVSGYNPVIEPEIEPMIVDIVQEPGEVHSQP